MPPRVLITLVIIAGIGVGTGSLMFGLLMNQPSHASDRATFIAIGSTLLASSVAGLFAHLFGGFRSLENFSDDDDRR